MIPCYFVKLAFGRDQLLFVLHIHHFQVKVEEPLCVRHLHNLEGAEALEELVEHLEQPQVELCPVAREVVVDEDGSHQS